jgi:hypothetical protein
VTLLARVLAVIAALAGVIVGLAGLVRAAALASDGRLVWSLPTWWTDLGDGAAGWTVGLVAAAAATVAVAYLIVALRQLAPPPPPASVVVGGAQVRLAALERLVVTRLRAEIPGLAPVRVRIAWQGGGWDVSALVDVPANDLTGLRDRAVRVVRAELATAADGELVGLDLEVRRFVGPTAPRGPG